MGGCDVDVRVSQGAVSRGAASLSRGAASPGAASPSQGALSGSYQQDLDPTIHYIPSVIVP